MPIGGREGTMTITTGSPHAGRLADRRRTIHALVVDERDRLALRRLRPWHRMHGPLAGPCPVLVQGDAMVGRGRS